MLFRSNRCIELLSTGKQINVAWSGGIDSTFVLFSLYNYANDKSQISVYGTYNSIIESGDLFDRFIKNRINIFLSNFKQYLENISIDDINNYIHSQIEFHSKPFNNIKDDIIYYTDIFLHNHTNFNLKNIILEKNV